MRETSKAHRIENEETESKPIEEISILLHDPLKRFVVGLLHVDVTPWFNVHAVPVYPRLFNLRTCETMYQKLEFNVDVDVLCTSNDPSARFHARPMNGSRAYAIIPPLVIIAKDTSISNLGHIKVGRQLVQIYGSCWWQQLGTMPSDDTGDRSEIVDHAFIVSQYWGENYFHAFIEDFPRLAYFHDFLLTRKDIKIVVSSTTGYPLLIATFLGISKDRLIAGPVRARYVYLPPPSIYCGIQSHMHNHKFRTILQDRLNVFYPNYRHTRINDRPSIVLVRRSGQRKLIEHDQLKKVLEYTFPEYRIVEFRDDPSPAMEEILLRFYRASAVIGPHGAGLSNLMVCRPGTVVVEMLTNDPNYCYMELSVQLGLRYFGTVASEDSSEGSVHANINEVVHILKSNLY
jgi:hypothetical protein